MSKKRNTNKKDILIIPFVLILLGFAVLVLAQGLSTLNSPASSGNYSMTMNFSCANVSMSAPANVSLYYNASGGAATVFFQTFDTGNLSANWTTFENDSLYVGNLPDSSLYNFTCVISNNSDIDTNSNYTEVSDVTIDNTAPRVTNFINTVDGGYYNGSVKLNLNVTVNDSFWVGYQIDSVLGPNSVSFNITNSSGKQVSDNFTTATNSTTFGFGAIVDISGFADGQYNITVWANDTLNMNNTERIQITIDNSGPTIAHTCSPTSTTLGQIVTCTCTGADTVSGINYTYDGSYTTTDGTSTVTEITTDATGTITRTCTVKNRVGNSTSGTASYTVTSAAGSSVSPGGGTTTSTWKTAFFPSDEQLEQGYTKEVSTMKRVKVAVTGSGGTETHYVGVKELTTTTATILITSDPVEVELDVGEDAKVDVTDDGYYDIYVKLNSITGGKADITVQKISEAIPEGGGAVGGTGEAVTGQEPDTGEGEPEEGRSLTWLWIVIIVIVLILVGAGVAKKKK